MTKQEVITRFCQLSRIVCNHFAWEHPADCFCDGGPDVSYEYSEVVMSFIERAVASQLSKVPRGDNA